MGRVLRLECENFKSYKGHQTIGPFDQFSCIVGPNGSGKSNVMDAISFVLGINSAQLRSHTLKDMIYRPSALRPQGQGPNVDTRLPRRAFVTLVYENAQKREVKFTRIVTSAGESEYRINDKHVPHSVYNAALVKENILVKAKNFLVFQGDVESVANQNPADLTKLIEQISGSLELKEEYDRLKLEQERAAESSSHAYNRKRGVQAEIKQYQEQKQEAETFERLVQERRDHVVRYLLWKLYHVEAKQRELESDANARQIKSDDAGKLHLELENAFKDARKQQALAHRECTTKELHIKKLKKSIEGVNPESMCLEEKMAHLRNRLEQTKKSGERLKRDTGNQELVVENLEKGLQNLARAVQEYESTVPEAKLSGGPQLSTQQLRVYEELKQQVSLQAAVEQQQMQDLERQRKMELENVNRITSKLEELNARKAQLLEEETQLNEQGHSLTADGESLTAQLQLRQQELTALENERIQTHKREVELNERLQATLNKLMEARVGQRENEKDTKFRECLTTMKQMWPGVHGRLVDLCRPTQGKYENAVATALGRNLDAIIVEDQKTAIDCINYMREQRVGTATFLPLNTLEPRPINDRYRSIARGARLAVDVINCEKKYEGVIQFTCGNTMVCDTLQIARHICYTLKEAVKAVTVDGTVIHQNGLITGGQTADQPRTSWKNSDVDALVRTRDALLNELNELSKHKRMGSAEESARSDCSGLEAQLTVMKEEYTTLERRALGVQDEIKHLEGEIATTEAPRPQNQQRLDELIAAIAETNKTIEQVEDQVFADFCGEIGVSSIRDYEALRFGASQEVTQRRAEFAAQRSRLETQLAFEREQLSDLQARLSKLETTYLEDTEALKQAEQAAVDLQARLEKMRTDLATYTHELARCGEEEENMQKRVDELRQELEAKGRDVEAYLKEMNLCDAEIEKVHAERTALFRKCKLEDIELPMLRGTMDSVLTSDDVSSTQNGSSMEVDNDEPSQLSIRTTDWEVEVDYTALTTAERRDSSQERDAQFREELKRRGNEIENMAPNLKAIDRLEGVEQRLDEVEEDYSAARRAAKRAASEFEKIKQQRYATFYDAYSHIAGQIDRIYKDLTSNESCPEGGTAYLSLDNIEEPYLGNVKYHAMPPMKRFRDMDMLSGGEKSVAALALLFAIHSYQPAPFFVLDEVDAALDTLNVEKIASYIRQNSSDTFQFIVISLKNALYEKAESLVGIYRDQGNNSSRTLTLKLDEYGPV